MKYSDFCVSSICDKKSMYEQQSQENIEILLWWTLLSMADRVDLCCAVHLQGRSFCPAVGKQSADSLKVLAPLGLDSIEVLPFQNSSPLMIAWDVGVVVVVVVVLIIKTRPLLPDGGHSGRRHLLQNSLPAFTI